MIGIIGAMEEEVAALKQDMEIREIEEIASMEFCRGTLCGQEVTVVRSGVGKVNAAICCQILAGHFGAEAVINTGIAGSLDAQIDIGDMVISTDAVQHDVDASTFGYPQGQIPRMDTLAFAADPLWIRRAVEANRKANPEIQTFTGRVASGDQFIDSKEKKTRIHDTFDACCTEMEGAAIAQAAWLNRIPYLIIRSISDKADDSAHMDYDVFEAKAAANSVRLVTAMAKALSH